ncbi:MAG: hypothetical protein SFU83_23730 [Meiothermus sp.]|nr:hypothetical protein [Meiothermus sp.]
MSDTPTTPAYYVFEAPEGREFYFRKPRTPEIDLCMKRMRTALTEASADFSLVLISPDQKADWKALLEEKPGYGSRVANKVLEQLGFPVEG